MKPLKVILSGGGTGGHIYPAIAIANEIKSRYPDADILFVGAKDRMEMEKVPQYNYSIKGLWISGIERKLWSKNNIMFPFKLISSLWNARKIVKSFKPDIAIGTGGFASGPLLQMANKSKVPTVLQEQNSYPGITNKILSKKANVICVAYEGLDRFFPKEKIELTGNPIRQDLLDIENVEKSEARNYFKLNPGQKTLLVLGGSLGARRINQLIESKLEFFNSNNVQLIWQTGKLYYDQYKHLQSESVQIHAFINKMNWAYGVADMIISRAGASSVSELCVVGKPTLFIPSPNVAEDHQTKNAQAIVNKNAALLVKEKDLEESFEMVFKDLISNVGLGNAIKTLALPNATKDIVDKIENLIKN